MMKTVWLYTGIGIALSILILFFIIQIWSKPQILTEEQIKIIEIANAKVLSLGVDIKDKDVCYDEENRKWKEELFRLIKESPAYAERFKVLEGRDYQAVIYTPKRKYGVDTVDGVVWVFVDRKSEEVIKCLPRP